MIPDKILCWSHWGRQCSDTAHAWSLRPCWDAHGPRGWGGRVIVRAKAVSTLSRELLLKAKDCSGLASWIWVSNLQPGRGLSLSFQFLGFQCFPEDSWPIFKKWRYSQTYSLQHSPKDLFRHFLRCQNGFRQFRSLTISEELLTGFEGHKFGFNFLNPAILNLFYGSGPQSGIWLQHNSVLESLLHQVACISLGGLMRKKVTKIPNGNVPADEYKKAQTCKLNRAGIQKLDKKTV